MKQQLAALRTHWEARAPREKQLLKLSAIVIVVALLWTLHDSVSKERKRLDHVIPVAAAQLKGMQEEAAELARLHNQPALPKLDPLRLQDAVQAAVKAQGLVAQVRADGGQIVLSGDAQSFNMLVDCLSSVQAANGLKIAAMDVGRGAADGSGAGKPGSVRFEVRLAPAS